ncbi:MAG: IMPACT family protein, partial [Vicinamibacteria bacterium]
FVGIAAPASTLEEVERELERIRDEFPDATHHCWAYVLGNPDAGPRMRFDDAGEPAGTAGKPMLNVLQRRKVGDALVVVVRYFGGVKLGAGGLVRAYSATASRVLEQVELVTLTPRFPLLLRLDYGDEQMARRVLTRLGIEVLSVDYAHRVVLGVRATEQEQAALVEEISAATSGRAKFGPSTDAV